MKKELLTLSAAIMLLATPAKAQNCAVPPTCESLGYTLNWSDCTGLHILKCPFDQNKIYCSAANCAADYQLHSCPAGGTCDWCGNKARLNSCNAGYIKTSYSCIACTRCTNDDTQGYLVLDTETFNYRGLRADCLQKKIYISYPARCSTTGYQEDAYGILEFTSQQECEDTFQTLSNYRGTQELYDNIMRQLRLCLR